ncbi:hypothetical protein RND81_13G064700 [Saponaria officinalis]|uniref:Uncharacterized protein n=1 Tax=Saponaria officinalis TaxID=3572 RepID=A0AAW1GWQ9_SAPOF
MPHTNLTNTLVINKIPKRTMWSNQNSSENFPRNGFHRNREIQRHQSRGCMRRSWILIDLHHDFCHVFHKVPHGDSPYVIAKYVQGIW